MEMLKMVLIGSTVDQDVVKNTMTDLWSLGDKVTFIAPLKRPRRTSETECKHPGLIFAKVGLKGCLVFFTELKQDLMESRTQVQFRKSGCTPTHPSTGQIPELETWIDG
jgi:hypothetical protein